MKHRRILLWGARDKAQILHEMILEQELGKIAFIFDMSLQEPLFETEAEFLNDPLVLREHLNSIDHFAVCIGGERGYARYRTGKCLEQLGLRPFPIVHPSALIDPSVRIPPTLQAMPRCVVQKF